MENKIFYNREELNSLYRYLCESQSYSIDIDTLRYEIFLSKFNYQSLKDTFNRYNLCEVLEVPFEDVPLYINSQYNIDEEIARWRLALGK